MDWKKAAPWNWFKHEEPGLVARPPARVEAPADPFDLERWLEEGIRRFLREEPSVPSRPAWLRTPSRPSVDISEGKKVYTVRVDLPGVELEDLSIEVDDHTLVIRAERHREHEEEDEGYHCIERSYGAIQRVLSLPEDADAEAIDAEFRNGVLKIRISRHAVPAAQGRIIEIRPG